MFLCALPNKAYDNASTSDDLPDPFVPTMSVVFSLQKSISVKLFPVERKFRYFIRSKTKTGVSYSISVDCASTIRLRIKVLILDLSSSVSVASIYV